MTMGYPMDDADRLRGAAQAQQKITSIFDYDLRNAKDTLDYAYGGAWIPPRRQSRLSAYPQSRAAQLRRDSVGAKTHAETLRKKILFAFWPWTKRKLEEQARGWDGVAQDTAAEAQIYEGITANEKSLSVTIDDQAQTMRELNEKHARFVADTVRNLPTAPRTGTRSSPQPGTKRESTTRRK